MLKIPPKVLPTLELAAYDYNLLGADLLLIAGWCYTESAFDPYAMRYEPGFHVRYVTPIGLRDPTEEVGRSTSWGLFQVMGQTAYEYGFRSRYFTHLCDPSVNIEYAAAYLRHHYNATQDWDLALACYNGGALGNRAHPARNAGYVRRVKDHAELFGWEESDD